MCAKDWRAPVVRALKYAGVDVVLFPLNICLAWALTEWGLQYQLATVCGFFVHVTLAFFVNRRWTFHSSIETSSGLLKTWLIGASDLVIAVAATTAFVEYLGLSFFFARSYAAIIVFVWDYVLNSIITFRTKVFR